VGTTLSPLQSINFDEDRIWSCSYLGGYWGGGDYERSTFSLWETMVSGPNIQGGCDWKYGRDSLVTEIWEYYGFVACDDGKFEEILKGIWG
jgi:hypothetical protein